MSYQNAIENNSYRNPTERHLRDFRRENQERKERRRLLEHKTDRKTYRSISERAEAVQEAIADAFTAPARDYDLMHILAEDRKQTPLASDTIVETEGQLNTQKQWEIEQAYYAHEEFLSDESYNVQFQTALAYTQRLAENVWQTLCDIDKQQEAVMTYEENRARKIHASNALVQLEATEQQESPVQPRYRNPQLRHYLDYRKDNDARVERSEERQSTRARQKFLRTELLQSAVSELYDQTVAETPTQSELPAEYVIAIQRGEFVGKEDVYRLSVVPQFRVNGIYEPDVARTALVQALKQNYDYPGAIEIAVGFELASLEDIVDAPYATADNSMDFSDRKVSGLQRRESFDTWMPGTIRTGREFLPGGYESRSFQEDLVPTLERNLERQL